MAQQKTLIGTGVKMAVNFSYPSDPSVTLDSINFTTTWYTSRLDKAVTLTKAQHVRETATVEGVTVVSFFAVVDTGSLGPGKLRMRLKAYLPAGSDDRIEYAEVDTDVFVI